tara:strand:- start:256 stop:1053 length:798 start_codon:yes stop_codon:yes gene_type:complete
VLFENNYQIIELQNKLKDHLVYDSIQNLCDLQCFVEHHIYSVWDFMSLVKYLQCHLAPAIYPWYPNSNGNLRRFINEIVLEEESDQSNFEGKYLSHFEIYQCAMEEIGANIKPSKIFIEGVKNKGIDEVLQLSTLPINIKNFIRTTFNFITSNKLHVVASAFTFGRETIVPIMFRSMVDRLAINKSKCPSFFYYMNRHIEVDDAKHGPMAMNLLAEISNNDENIKKEIFQTAIKSLTARIEFWDGILESINQNKSDLTYKEKILY